MYSVDMEPYNNNCVLVSCDPLRAFSSFAPDVFASRSKYVIRSFYTSNSVISHVTSCFCLAKSAPRIFSLVSAVVARVLNPTRKSLVLAISCCTFFTIEAQPRKQSKAVIKFKMDGIL